MGSYCESVSPTHITPDPHYHCHSNAAGSANHYFPQRSPSVQNSSSSSSSSSQRWKEATTGQGTGEACNRRAVRKEKASLVEHCFVRTACWTRQLLFFSSDLTPALPLSLSTAPTLPLSLSPRPPPSLPLSPRPPPSLFRCFHLGALASAYEGLLCCKACCIIGHSHCLNHQSLSLSPSPLTLPEPPLSLSLSPSPLTLPEPPVSLSPSPLTLPEPPVSLSLPLHSHCLSH